MLLCISDGIDIKKDINNVLNKKTHTGARFGYITLSQCGENRFAYLEPTSVHMHVIKREKSRKEIVYRI